MSTKPKNMQDLEFSDLLNQAEDDPEVAARIFGMKMNVTINVAEAASLLAMIDEKLAKAADVIHMAKEELRDAEKNGDREYISSFLDENINHIAPAMVLTKLREELLTTNFVGTRDDRIGAYL